MLIIAVARTTTRRRDNDKCQKGARDGRKQTTHSSFLIFICRHDDVYFGRRKLYMCLLYAIFWAAGCTDVEHSVIIINHSEINIARSILSHLECSKPYGRIG